MFTRLKYWFATKFLELDESMFMPDESLKEEIRLALAEAYHRGLRQGRLQAKEYKNYDTSTMKDTPFDVTSADAMADGSYRKLKEIERKAALYKMMTDAAKARQ